MRDKYSLKAASAKKLCSHLLHGHIQFPNEQISYRQMILTYSIEIFKRNIPKILSVLTSEIAQNGGKPTVREITSSYGGTNEINTHTHTPCTRFPRRELLYLSVCLFPKCPNKINPTISLKGQMYRMGGLYSKLCIHDLTWEQLYWPVLSS